MNGRVYDPEIARFISADPVLQSPTHLQSYNRYSYVWNNPLVMTDPSGYFSLKKFGNWVGDGVKDAGDGIGDSVKQAGDWVEDGGWKTIVAVGVGVYTAGLASGAFYAVGSVGNAIATGAISGAAAGFTGGGLATGNMTGAVRGALTGAVAGAVGGYANFGATTGWLDAGRRVAISAAGGCVAGEVSGGSCQRGAELAATVQAISIGAEVSYKRVKYAVPNLQATDLLSLANFITDRGFTGHEHLDNVGLIHMNGRVYDPEIARFISANPWGHMLLADGVNRLDNPSDEFQFLLVYEDNLGGNGTSDSRCSGTSGESVYYYDDSGYISSNLGYGDAPVYELNADNSIFQYSPDQMFACVGSECIEQMRLSAQRERAFTEGEIKLAQSIFGDEIDFSKSSIFNKKAYFFQPSDRPMAPDGNIYYHPDDHNYLTDFSLGTPTQRGTFMHELIHVWQHQQGINVRSAIFNRSYKYLPLNVYKSFSSYGLEQQGNIMRDYFYLKQFNWREKGNTTLQQYESVIPFGK